MRLDPCRLFSTLVPRCLHFLLASTVCLTAASILGCAGGSASSSTGTLTGNTRVTILATSTSNNQLSQFVIDNVIITLKSQSGNLVQLVPVPFIWATDFGQLNGSIEPIFTVSVPQDVYTSATVTMSAISAECVGLDFSEGSIAQGWDASPVKNIHLPAPITVTGTSMGLLVDLDETESVSPFTCVQSNLLEPTFTPTFNLTPVTIAATPTNITNGKAFSLHGLMGGFTIGGTGFDVLTGDSETPIWQVAFSNGTVFQGITGAGQLAPGLPVDMDVTIQADGSLQATRVAVYNTNPTNLTVFTGVIAEVSKPGPYDGGPVLQMQSFGSQGLIIDSSSMYGINNATFHTSGQLTNLQSLPFVASFNAANMVSGQHILVSSNALTDLGYYPYTLANTITLLPQTINGMVKAVSSTGNFTIYTVSLASYDLFPTLAVQAGQTTLLTNPGTVVVYVDSNTQMLNSGPIGVGSLMRCNGLVFNDSGTLRMDCAEVLDGVAE